MPKKKEKRLGVVDFARKGNVVRFYIGDVNKDYHGDDWNDKPYEHNAGEVYAEYVDHYIDVAFPFTSTVMEPADDWRYHGNSPFSKDDMKARKVPCIIVVPNDESASDSFSEYAASQFVAKVFFGDGIELINNFTDMNVIRNYNVINLYADL